MNDSVEHKDYHQPGFTLIEIIVTIFGFCMLILGLVALLSGSFLSPIKQSNLLNDQDQARKLSAKISYEIRDAQIGNNGAYVLDTALPQQIIFYSNADQDPAIERIRYFVQNSQLWKGVTEYNGTTYNTSTETTYMVQNNLANGGNPIFYYYDGTYVASSSQASMSQPVNTNLVKFVKVSLSIYNKAGVSGVNTYTITSGAAIRNLKTNLGQ